jgi:hypothetical protein
LAVVPSFPKSPDANQAYMLPSAMVRIIFGLIS